MNIDLNPRISITVDDVLRNQGADPETLRTRNPRLVKVAEKAIHAAQDHLDPKAIGKKYPIHSIHHNTLRLQGNHQISSSLVVNQLQGAKFMYVILCTVGPQIDELAGSISREDIVFGLAVDAVGSAAVESASHNLCLDLSNEAQKAGLQTTLPLSPGMVDWPVAEGQPAIFDLLEAEQIGVQLSPQYVMSPRKTVTMLIGVGNGFNSTKQACDFCTMQNRCRYQEQYRKHGKQS